MYGVGVDHEPSYLALHRSGELAERARRALSLLDGHCTVCPRLCSVDRLSDQPGLCKAAATRSSPLTTTTSERRMFSAGAAARERSSSAAATCAASSARTTTSLGSSRASERRRGGSHP